MLIPLPDSFTGRELEESMGRPYGILTMIGCRATQALGIDLRARDREVIPKMADEALFSPLSLQQAPARSRGILEQARIHFGFVPNLLASLAYSPMALGVYFNANLGFEFGTLSSAERQILLLTASRENDCNYCSTSHSAMAQFFTHVPGHVLIAIGSGERLRDNKLDALVNLTRQLVSLRGHVPRETIQAFFDVGYTKEQLLEVLLGIGIKTISNYFDHISATDVDDEFLTMISKSA